MANSANALPIVERALDAVVAIDVHKTSGTAKCSGFVYAKARVLTAAHCVQDATLIRIKFHNTSSSVAELVGLSVADDVAVLAVAGTSVLPLRIGRSSDLRQGDVVYALGHPMGYEWSSTRGVVSAFIAGGVYGVNGSAPLIQHDAGTRPGSSGGPLLNERGLVVGFIVGGHGPSISFAVTIDHAMKIAASFK